ncbi:hypothetical protein E3J49_04600 [Candidatus Bathyarchaeota archaeon]|nr:MAG: hypothetical protein E3J49_04600 [Candidatus Bathyarchaeota archaeon]
MRLVNNIFSLKASRITRCLLVDFGKKWTIRELAKKADVSVGYTHAIITTLTNMGYVQRNDTDNKLVLLDPAKLLKRWAAFHQYDHFNTFLDYYTFEHEIERFLEKIAERIRKEQYALTSLAGASLVSPYVRPIDVHFYVENKEKEILMSGLLDIKPTAGTGNVRMVIPFDKGVFYGTRQIEGIRVVSNIQLYVDLLNYSARGEDAAKNLYTVMEKEWSKILIGSENV